MRLTLSVILGLTLTLSACTTMRESRMNPANWFGDSRSEPVAQQPAGPSEVNPLMPTNTRPGLFANLREQSALYVGTPIDQVTDVVVEPVPGGAIVRATGIVGEDRVFDIRLTSENDENVPVDGVLTYQLRGIHSDRPTRTLSPRVRTVMAARRLTNQELADVRVIRVEGLRNVQSTTRQ
ncbi:MAG: hypothetical protein AAGF36_03215 [Pseudomonadota bacterium]